MKKRLFPIRYYSLMVVCIGLFAGCGSREGHSDHEHEAVHNHKDHDHDHEGHDHENEGHDHENEGDRHDEEDYGAEGHNPDEIVMTAEQAKSAGVVVEPVVTKDFTTEIKAGGQILTASGDESAVVAPAAGIVSMKKGFTEGMPVAKGAFLLSVSSSKLPEGELTRRNELALTQAEQDYTRARKLIEDKLITEKELLAAKTEYERAKLAYEATGGKASGGVTVSAPSGGYVKECLVSDGDYVEVGQPIMRLTQNRKLYLKADVRQKDWGKLGAIRMARFRPSYSETIYNLEDLDGKLVASGETTGTGSAFVPVTFEFNNTGGVVPGSYAEVFLVTGKRENVISVPKTALTEEQGVHFVYVKVDDEGYMKREVKLGESDGDHIEIVSGLKPGENLVTEGAIHVKLASAKAAIPAHNHNH